MPKNKMMMPPQGIEVIRPGDASGNGMIIKISLPSGLEIFGLPTKNFYGGQFDLGPTWNWLVMADKPFLVDTGRAGQGPELMKMFREVNLDVKDLDFILITHGHEDHDGGLAQLVDASGARVLAHRIYDRTIRFYPDLAPKGIRPDFPAACWHCFMPKEFSDQNCLEYQKKRSLLEIETIGDLPEEIAPGITAFHVPGHAPDSLALVVGDELLLSGDTVLPGITPWPTAQKDYVMMSPVLPSEYTRAREIYGLESYIQSLKKLAKISREHPGLQVLPGHRFYYRDQWNILDLSGRIEELQAHINERSSAILGILEKGPLTPVEIARKYFDPRVLKGPGMHMAMNEAISHAELLMDVGDLAVEEKKYVFQGRSGCREAVCSA